jgi:hypothetical protein
LLQKHLEELKMDNTHKLLGGLLMAVLLAGANTATAATVILDDSDNVIEVRNLELDLDVDENDGFYDVQFTTGLGADMYGFEPAEFDFFPGEEVVGAVAQLNAALNAASTVPAGAGSVGSDTYYVPGIEIDYPGDLFPTIWIASIGELLAGTWDLCETQNCLLGIGVVRAEDDILTFARFTVAAPVPVPAAVWLFGSALGLLGWMRRKQN